MLFKKILLLPFIVYLLLTGCGGHHTFTYPLDTIHLPENNLLELPSLPRLSNQTPNEYFLEQFFQLCENNTKNPYYPFSLSLDFRKIRSILYPKINEWKYLSTKDFIYAFNRWAQEYGLLSHLYLKQEEKNFLAPYNSWFQNQLNFIYIDIKNFSENYSTYRVEKKMSLANHKKKLIIDLRDNPGGLQSNLEHLLSFFLPPRTVYAYLINRQHLNYLHPSDYESNWVTNHIQKIVQHVSPYWTSLVLPNHNFPIFSGKVAILINEKSFSASEIFAYVLKTLTNNVKIFGTSTQGGVQNSIAISANILNAKLYYPIGELFTLQNTSLEGIGVYVDEPTYEDETIDKAVEWLLLP